ncbi:hypothetical protein [Bosea sp. TAB14]|uniref:hypothetical protein n=1 Tax=Bosea sp. TAB14 TaxID=3237481 RepID=UPI003F8F8088
MRRLLSFPRLKHFQAKWAPFRVKKMRASRNPETFRVAKKRGVSLALFALLLTVGFLASAHFGGFAQNAQTDRGVVADLISSSVPPMRASTSNSRRGGSIWAGTSMSTCPSCRKARG